MKLTNSNYFSKAAMSGYWSVSQFKEFDRCEASGLATARGEYIREETDALLMGKYVDAYFSGESGEFRERYADVMYKRDGSLYAKFERCEAIVEAVKRQPKMMEYLEGDKQVIITGSLFGVDWKAKLDVFNGERIVDLKCVKDFADVYEEGFGRRSWIEYWGYDIQGAIYQALVKQNTGKTVPFYLAAVTKEIVPDVALIQIPQHVLDTAFKVVESKIDHFDLVKSGDLKPTRCGKCTYCKVTKVIEDVEVFEGEE